MHGEVLGNAPGLRTAISQPLRARLEIAVEQGKVGRQCPIQSPAEPNWELPEDLYPELAECERKCQKVKLSAVSTKDGQIVGYTPVTREDLDERICGTPEKIACDLVITKPTLTHYEVSEYDELFARIMAVYTKAKRRANFNMAWIQEDDLSPEEWVVFDAIDETLERLQLEQTLDRQREQEEMMDEMRRNRPGH